MVSELLPPALALIHTADGTVLRVYEVWLRGLIHGHGWPELVFGLSVVAATWAVVYPFYRKRIFLRV
jgi:hypothetical protein